jgi:hypothetical protein
MPLFLGNIFGWIIKNPLPILVLVIACFIYFQMIETNRLKIENQSLETRIESVQKENKDIRTNLDIVNTIQQQNSQVRDTQTIIRERIRDVPVYEEDRPFANNPGLLDRIDVMRDYQQSYRSRANAATNEQITDTN